MPLTDWIGTLAGALTTAAFVPQVVKIWVTKSAEDVSYLMFAVFSVGVALWLVYGLAIESIPIIVANVVTLALSLLVVTLKTRYRRPASLDSEGPDRS
ncbi:MAG: SemiSWEET transporter [Betaproteobacteria bacterium]